MDNFYRSIEFDLTNTNGKISWYSLYAYESEGTIVYEVTINNQGKSQASSQNASKLLANGIEGLLFEGLAGSKSSGLDYDYNFNGDASGFSFTVSSEDQPLTLESITELYPKRGGKATILPYAPTALDDSYSLFEDGSAGLQSPSQVPQPVILDVLANDTDANGFKLSIQDIVERPSNGSVEIIDADNDGLGDYLSYTPYVNQSLDSNSFDTIKYFVNNGNGGTDFATAYIALAPVADIPILRSDVTAGENVDETVIRVWASPSDKDGSEFISSIDLSSSLPDGVTVIAGDFVSATQTSDAYRNFTVLTDLDQDSEYNFDLEFSATSTEVLNGDNEIGNLVESIKIAKSRDSYENFLYTASRQNMWTTGDAYILDWAYTLDLVDIDFDRAKDVDIIFDAFEYDIDVELYAGLEFYVNLSAGEVSASSLFNIQWDQYYNQSTDQLLIIPTASLNDAAFETIFANGKFGLNFVYDILLDLQFDLGDLETPRSDNLIDVYFEDDGKYNLFEFGTEDLELEIEIPETGITITAAWPQLEVESLEYVPASNSLTGGYEYEADAGISNNFFNINMDIDEVIVLALNAAGIPIPQEAISGDFSWGSYQLFDIDLGIGLNVTQAFEMLFEGISGEIQFTESSEQPDSIIGFTMGESLLINNASRFDSNFDGVMNYIVSSSPDTVLSNDTGIGLNFNGGIEGPAFEAAGFVIGPLGDWEFSETPASFSVFNDEFKYLFAESSFESFSPDLLV